MKKLTVILLVLTLLLSGCGCSKKPVETEPTEASTEATQAPTTAPTEAPTTEPTVEPTEPAEYYHPLTGELLEKPWSGQLVAVMVNNIKAAMPQHGLSQADIIYEIEEEGSVTRNMAIFSDLSKVDSIGSIRSTRTYFVSVAASYDAYLVHCGTSKHARNGGYDDTDAKIENWKDLDQLHVKNYPYFFRDEGRYNSGYAWEHTLFTSGEKLTEALQNFALKEAQKDEELAELLEGKKLAEVLEDEELAKTLEDKALSNPSPVFGFKEGIDLGGETAEEITIKFKGTKTTSFTYDAETGRYARSQHGGASVDGSNEQAETVKNVIAIYTEQWGCGTCSGHQYYDTIGSGEGYAATNGKIVPIKWSRESVSAPYVYTLEDGSPLELDVGNSYIAVVGNKFPIEYK